MYLNPDRLTSDQIHAIDDWLVANGCRHHVALDPVIVKGNHVEYTAICKRDPKSIRRIPIIGDEYRTLGRKTLRIRVLLRLPR